MFQLISLLTSLPVILRAKISMSIHLSAIKYILHHVNAIIVQKCILVYHKNLILYSVVIASGSVLIKG